MTCPKCNIEMIKGSLNEGLFWTAKKLVRLSKWTRILGFGYADYIVEAHRCPQCNKIELVAAEIK